MFNKDVINVLTQINGIADSVILKHPITVAKSESDDMIVACDISKLDADQFPDMGIMDLGGFLNIFKLFPDDADCDISGNTINISSGATSSTYITDLIALMDAFDIDSSRFDKTEAVPSVATFDITSDDIKKIKSASGVFKDLDEVIFESKDGDVIVSLGSTGKFNAKSNTFAITKPAQTSKEFNIHLAAENFKKLPVSDYQVQVKYNSSKDAYRVMLFNKSLDGFKIMMGVIA